MKEIILILFGLRSSRYFCIKDMFGGTFEDGGGGGKGFFKGRECWTTTSYF